MPQFRENLHLIDEQDVVLRAAGHEIEGIFEAERRIKGDVIDGPFPAFPKGAGGLAPMLAWAFRRTRHGEHLIVLKAMLSAEGLMFFRCDERKLTVSGKEYTQKVDSLIHQIPLMDPKFFEKVKINTIRFTELYDL